MSLKTGPITKIVRNRAIPVSTWFGGDVGSPRAFRVNASTTRILVNDVTSSSADGAIESTVIARIRVTAVLGLLPPTLMSTPPSTTGATGATGAVGGVGAVGAAEAGSASRRTTVRTPSMSSGASHSTWRYRDASAGPAVRACAGSRTERAVTSGAPSGHAAP